MFLDRTTRQRKFPAAKDLLIRRRRVVGAGGAQNLNLYLNRASTDPNDGVCPAFYANFIVLGMLTPRLNRHAIARAQR